MSSTYIYSVFLCWPLCLHFDSCCHFSIIGLLCSSSSYSRFVARIPAPTVTLWTTYPRHCAQMVRLQPFQSDSLTTRHGKAKKDNGRNELVWCTKTHSITKPGPFIGSVQKQDPASPGEDHLAHNVEAFENKLCVFPAGFISSISLFLLPVYVHVCVHACVRACVRARAHACVCVCVCVCVCMHMS